MELLQILRSVKESASQLTTPSILAEQLQIIFRDESKNSPEISTESNFIFVLFAVARNNLIFVCIGFGIGSTCGYMIGTWLTRPYYPRPVMKAVACLGFWHPDLPQVYTRPAFCSIVSNSFFFKSLIHFVCLQENVIPTVVRVPSLCSTTDILIRVRAASIHRIDAHIANGYGKNLRRMIQNYNAYDHQELPLVVGRGCAGIVEGVGQNSKSGLEVGDEVWMASPWHEAGVASQLVVAPESRVSRKPFIIGFEGAASLPYSGCMALSALKVASLDEITAVGKRYDNMCTKYLILC